MTETNDFALPDIGEGLTEAEIVSWHVAVGDTVAVNDIIVEVETAKAVVELPSPYAGQVVALHAAAGRTVEVGAPIISIGDPGVQPALPVETPAATAPPEEDERQPVLVGYGPTRAKVARRPRRTPTVRPPAAPRPSTPNQRPYAPPPVRKLARDLGIDLAGVTPTGARGQVTRDDLDRVVPLEPVTSPPAEPAETRIPVKGVRKHTAEAMVASAFTAPHVTEWVTVDVTRSLKLLDRMRADRAFAGVRLSPLVLVMRAALLALARHPEVNAKWDAATGEIVRYRDVNLGIAAATPRGLIVPNIRAAQSLTTRELADALADLVAEARAGKTAPDRMRDGTFTITNIGVFGVDGGTPILNPGEAAILCFGQIRRQPWEHKGKIALRSTTTLTLSFDHRLVDGELGSNVLAHTARILERPELGLVL